MRDLSRMYEERPFRDQGWQLVRVKGSNENIFGFRNGYVNLNVKVDPQWRDFWRSTYASVIAGYHQNKNIGIPSFRWFYS